MTQAIEQLCRLCEFAGIPENFRVPVASILLAVAFVLAVFVVQQVLKFAFEKIAHLWAKRSANTWDDKLCDAKVPTRIAHLISATVALKATESVFATGSTLFEIFSSGTNVYLAVAVAGTIYAIINAAMLAGMSDDRLRDVPIKGFFQALKVILTIVVAIWVLSIISNKSPAYFLSALGALTAILLIVFKDALLGFTAGILISANDLVRNNDWIEIPGMNVDGNVIDVSLTTVKVRNWDNTISCVPAYTLISTAFKNWRGMTESGGRRIKRAIYIDMQTVHFATETEIAHWNEIELLKPYLAKKLAEIREANATVSPESCAVSPANIRMITNLGTFRAYCNAYLRANKFVHKGMTILVRQRDLGATGLPFEIYVFTKDTRWSNYEDIQSDIFDHLLAVISEFNLRPFQEPSGHNFESVLSAKN